MTAIIIFAQWSGSNIVQVVVKLAKCYVCNCTECGRLHFWSQETAEKVGYVYACRGCEAFNEMKEEDLQ